jgi:hypothetical protein
VDAFAANRKVGPDESYAWLIPEYRGLSDVGNHFSVIMNPRSRHMYFSRSPAYAAYAEFKKIHLRGIVDDDWNMKPEIIPPDFERNERGKLFHRFMGEAMSGGRTILETCRNYMARDPENVMYCESYGRTLLRENPREARIFFQEASRRFPRSLFLKRLHALSLFEEYKKDNDDTLLEEGKTVLTDLLAAAQDRETILPCFILDIHYRLMRIAREQGESEQFDKWRWEFHRRYGDLGRPDFYPFSELLAAVRVLGN